MKPPEPLIRLQSIKKVYTMGGEPVYALNGVDIEIYKGEYVAIMGSSGSGKSTLMNIIGCLDQPTEGNYFLDGAPVHSLSDDELASVRNRTIGFVFQQFNLLPQLTAVDNVALSLAYSGMPRKQRQARAEQVLEMVGLKERMHHRPNQLSGGQQQRVSIARALANRPQLLLADEPTGALDSQTAEDIMGLIANLKKEGVTIVVVTHDPEVAEHASRTVRVKDGKVVSDAANRRAGSEVSGVGHDAPNQLSDSLNSGSSPDLHDVFKFEPSNNI